MVIKKQFLSLFMTIALLTVAMPTYAFCGRSFKNFLNVDKAKLITVTCERIWNKNKFAIGILAGVATGCVLYGTYKLCCYASRYLRNRANENNDNND